jgi:chromate transporter
VTPEASDTSSRVRPLLEVIRYCLWLGTTGFGGPVVLCSLMERDLVEQRGWLDKEQMCDVIAVCQTMPGPLAVQVAIFIGYVRCGFWGAWAAGWALILPASVMLGLLAALYAHLHDLPWLTAVIYGVSPAVIALILESWWRLIRLGIKDRFQSFLAAFSLLATLALPGLLTGVFFVAGMLGLGWYPSAAAWRSCRSSRRALSNTSIGCRRPIF